MSIKKGYGGTLFVFVLWFLLAVVFLTVPGCDETKNMTNGVITGPTDPATDPTTNGEVKKPDDETPGEPAPQPEPEPEPAPPIQTEVGTIEPGDFTGQVFKLTGPARYEAEPLPGVIVTIASGTRTGEKFLTNSEGRYVFRKVDGDALHLLAEKDDFEPKEVIVNRTKETTLSDGTFFESYEERDFQKSPGNIILGYRWPDSIRFILKETKVVPDLLLLYLKELPYAGVAGIYSQGIVTIKDRSSACLPFTLAHEIAHAHQHALIRHENMFGFDKWAITEEGKAYLKARERDWEEVGKMNYDGGHLLIPYESAAETAARFWNLRGRWDTPQCFLATQISEKNAPNRLRWAQEWLNKKY